jgi:hypothetical protein
MAAVFDTLPSHAPDLVVRDETLFDPFLLVDDAGIGVENDNKAAAARTKASDEIDWLPQSLKDRVDQHRPASGDIDAIGNVNKERLTEEANKLFGNIMTEMVFVNFYQLKQMVQRFAGYWGFVVSTQNNVHLVCFFTKSSTKAWEVNVSPRKQRGRQSIKTGCGFLIRVANDPRMKTAKRHRTPVRITKLNLEHGDECIPGLKEQRMAKKSTGRIFGALELQKLDSVVQIIADGNVSTKQLRSMLKDHIPPGYAITADDVRNIRVRCFKYSMEETIIDEEAAEKVIAFKPLDEDESLNLPDTDTCRVKTAEFMREVFQDSREGWKTLDFLEKCKEGTPGFDYRVNKDEDGRPTAVVWITNTMRENWRRFGSTIFLDAMKRKLNSLHWPYIGAVALDHENRVALLCECLCLEEELEQYAFVINSLAEMEPRRKKSTIRLIFADCFLKDRFLALIGLSRPYTTIAWDAFHLKSHVWPQELGQRLFDQLESDLGNMLYGETREEYDAAYGRIAVSLRSKPDKLQYIKTFYDHPERFAHYFIKRVPGNLRKKSSQPAESNHSSIVARVSAGSNQDMVRHIKALFDRQLELRDLHQQDDAKYEKISRSTAHETNDPSEAEAIKTLSKFNYEDYWLDVVERGEHYSHSVLASGASRVHKNETRNDSARIIQQGERCICDRYLAFESMCEHEYAIHGKFVKGLFADRMFQPCQIERRDQVTIDDAASDSFLDGQSVGGSSADIGEDNWLDQSERRFTQDGEDDGVAITNDDDDEGHSSSDDIALADLDRRKRPAGCDNGDISKKSKKRKLLPVPRGRLRQIAGTLVDLASHKNVNPQLSVTVAASMLQLQDLARGQNFDDVVEKANMIVQTAKLTTQSRTMQPRHGPEANNVGRPRSSRMVGNVMARNGGTQPRKRQTQKSKCTFCQSSVCGNITSCKALKALGQRIRVSELPDFVTNDLAYTNARHDAIKLKRLVTADNPILEILPVSTKWLVLHSLYNRNAMATSATTEAQAVVEITCYGELGTVLEGLATNAANFDHVIAEYSAVRDWIAASAKKNIGKSATRLIISSDWKCDYTFSV